MRRRLTLTLAVLLTLLAPLCTAAVTRTDPNRASATGLAHSAHPQKSQLNHRSHASQARVVTRAHQLIGHPYRRGGSSVTSGFDCSGLLVYLFRTEAGIKLPRTTGEMIHGSGSRVGRSALKPGDVVFFNHNGRGNTSHAGLYVGNGQLIHALSSGERIRLDSLANHYWQNSYITARRFRG